LVGVAPPSPGPSALKVSSASAPDLSGPAAASGVVSSANEVARPAASPPVASIAGEAGHGGNSPPRLAFYASSSLEEDDEATVVSQVPSEILGQLAGDRITGRPSPIEDEAAEWKRVFDEFVKLKRECGEPIDGISFEKFKNTLRKNRDQLLQRHGCKSVKFSVYVKQGKAALKANPVRT
jgi:hypothetical protein